MNYVLFSVEIPMFFSAPKPPLTLTADAPLTSADALLTLTADVAADVAPTGRSTSDLEHATLMI